MGKSAFFVTHGRALLDPTTPCPPRKSRFPFFCFLLNFRFENSDLLTLHRSWPMIKISRIQFSLTKFLIFLYSRLPFSFFLSLFSAFWEILFPFHTIVFMKMNKERKWPLCFVGFWVRTLRVWVSGATRWWAWTSFALLEESTLHVPFSLRTVNQSLFLTPFFPLAPLVSIKIPNSTTT